MTTTAAPLLSELTRDEARAIGRDGVVVLPLGATEQHGPHLPLGTDTLHAEHVVRGAADRLAGACPVAIAPVLPYGYSPHHVGHGGTMSIGAATYGRLLVDLGASLAAGGCRRLFLVNGHGGNRELIVLAAREIARRHDVHAGACTWWALAGARLRADAPDGARVPGHAGAFETAAIRALRPELVTTAPAPRTALPAHGRPEPERGYHHERPRALDELDGYTDDPALGDAAAGRLALEAGIDALADALRAFARDSGAIHDQEQTSHADR